MEWIVGIFILLAILGFFSKPTSCDICGLPFKKNILSGKLKGKSSFYVQNAILKWKIKLANKHLIVNLAKNRTK